MYMHVHVCKWQVNHIFVRKLENIVVKRIVFGEIELYTKDLNYIKINIKVKQNSQYHESSKKKRKEKPLMSKSTLAKLERTIERHLCS